MKDLQLLDRRRATPDSPLTREHMEQTRPAQRHVRAALVGEASVDIEPLVLGASRAGQPETTEQARQLLRAVLCLLLLSYFVVGVFGRFPWKADEPYSFGIVMEMLEDGQWLVPHVADQSFLEKPPLVYWLGAASAKLLGSIAPHESSRLALLLLVVATVFALSRSAAFLLPEVSRWRSWLRSASGPHRNELFEGETLQRNYPLFAVLLFAGTLGVTEQVHKLTADLGQLAGCAIALCGLIRIGTMSADRPNPLEPRASMIAGMTVGVGVGVAFMSKGLLAPGLIALTWLSCLSLPAYRRPPAKTAARVAFGTSLPWFLIWPALLHDASPDLFDEWFWTNNVGRFLGQGDLGGTGVPLVDKMASLALAAFPALPLCLAGFVLTWRAKVGNIDQWTARKDAPGHTCVALFVTLSLVVVLSSGSFRDNYLLPLLPPFALLGLPAMTVPNGRFTPFLKKATDVFFALAVSIPFVIWLQLATTGTVWPSALLVSIENILPVPFDLRASWLSPIIALSAFLLWAYARRQPWSRGSTVSWCIGVAMLWTVSLSLLLPWIDAARSYQAVFTDLGSRLVRPNCLATANLGESELAMLEYVTGIEATRLHQGRSGSGDRSRPSPAAAACEWRLVLSKPATAIAAVDDKMWRHVWYGSRPADTNERFDLYRHVPAPGRVGAQGPHGQLASLLPTVVSPPVHPSRSIAK
jgi:4-amino-4-deoxy-L-arabinose transferase-like glycosyltransferase